MLHIFLRQRALIELFVEMIPELKEDKLMKADWNDLVDIMRLLKSFKKLIILREKRGTLYELMESILWGFDMLLDMLEKEKAKSRSLNASFRKALKSL